MDKIKKKINELRNMVLEYVIVKLVKTTFQYSTVIEKIRDKLESMKK